MRYLLLIACVLTGCAGQIDEPDRPHVVAPDLGSEKGDDPGSAVSRCGDGTVQYGEECDDGNATDLDGCSSHCVKEARCELPTTGARTSDPETGHCYLLTDRTARQYTDAAAACTLRKGFLVTLTSHTENDLVAQLLGPTDHAWLDLRDLHHARQFTWQNGEPLMFQNWAPGEPNNGGGNEFCASFASGGLWDDESCNAARLTVCEIAP